MLVTIKDNFSVYLTMRKMKSEVCAEFIVGSYLFFLMEVKITLNLKLNLLLKRVTIEHYDVRTQNHYIRSFFAAFC